MKDILFLIMRYITFLKNSSVVLRLLFVGRPSAIFFGIRSVIINAINCGFFLTKLLDMLQIQCVHVFVEFFKRTPQVFDTSATITFPFMIPRIFTSSFHGHKNVVESLMTTRGETMRQIKKTYFLLTALTAARFGISFTKVGALCNNFLSTVAFTKETNISPFVSSRHFLHQKTTKFLSRKINFLHPLILSGSNRMSSI